MLESSTEDDPHMHLSAEVKVQGRKTICDDAGYVLWSLYLVTASKSAYGRSLM